MQKNISGNGVQGMPMPTQADSRPDNHSVNKYANGFGLVRRSVIENDEISNEAKLVYACLEVYAGSKRHCFPGLATIARDLGYKGKRADKDISEHIRELEAKGVIRVKTYGKHTRKTRNEYTLLADGSYGYIYRHWICNPAVHRSAKLLYTSLSIFLGGNAEITGGNGYCFPSTGQVGDMFGWTRDYVGRVMKLAVSYGMFTRNYRHGQNAEYYVPCPVQEVNATAEKDNRTITTNQSGGTDYNTQPPPNSDTQPDRTITTTKGNTVEVNTGIINTGKVNTHVGLPSDDSDSDLEKAAKNESVQQSIINQVNGELLNYLIEYLNGFGVEAVLSHNYTWALSDEKLPLTLTLDAYQSLLPFRQHYILISLVPAHLEAAWQQWHNAYDGSQPPTIMHYMKYNLLNTAA